MIVASHTAVFDRIMLDRAYPEIRAFAEQRTHSQLDDEYPGLVFAHRAQEWSEDEAFPGQMILRVWGTDDGASPRWAVVLERISYTATNVIGPYPTEKAAEEAAWDYWNRGIGASVVPLEVPQ